MDFSSSEELPYEEPSLSPINQEPHSHIPVTIYTTEMMEAEPSPSPTPSPKSSESQPNPEAQTIMLESVAEDIIHLLPHSTSDLVFDITPLTSLSPLSATNFTISSKPTISSPRTTTSAPSSPRKEDEEGNLIPRRRRTAMDDIRVIRRTPQPGESSQARAKIALHTSGAGELNYLPTDVLEEHRLA